MIPGQPSANELAKRFGPDPASFLWLDRAWKRKPRTFGAWPPRMKTGRTKRGIMRPRKAAGRPLGSDAALRIRHATAGEAIFEVARNIAPRSGP